MEKPPFLLVPNFLTVLKDSKIGLIFFLSSAVRFFVPRKVLCGGHSRSLERNLKKKRAKLKQVSLPGLFSSMELCVCVAF